MTRLLYKQNLNNQWMLLSPFLCSGLSAVSPGVCVTGAKPRTGGHSTSRSRRIGRPVGAHGGWELRRHLRAACRPGLRLSPQQQEGFAQKGGKHCSRRCFLGERACSGLSETPSLRGGANSGGDTGEQSLSPTGWSQVGGEPVGRREQEVEFKAHSKRHEGASGLPLDRNAPPLPSLN